MAALPVAPLNRLGLKTLAQNLYQQIKYYFHPRGRDHPLRAVEIHRPADFGNVGKHFHQFALGNAGVGEPVELVGKGAPGAGGIERGVDVAGHDYGFDGGELQGFVDIPRPDAAGVGIQYAGKRVFFRQLGDVFGQAGLCQQRGRRDDFSLISPIFRAIRRLSARLPMRTPMSICASTTLSRVASMRQSRIKSG